MSVTDLPLDRTEFLGVDFDVLTFNEAVSWLKSRIAEDRFGYIVTPNVDHLVRLNRAREEFAPLYEAAELRLCDSRVVSRLARFAGISLPVVPGSDLVVALFELVIDEGDTVMIIGAREPAISSLRARFPSVYFCHINAPWGLRDSPDMRSKLVAALSAHEARFALIAIGSPQQEMLAFDILSSFQMNGTALCIGASIDFIVGDERRAPRIIQQINLEWAWRLGSNPQRLWRRYLIEGPKIFPIFRAWKKSRSRYKTL